MRQFVKANSYIGELKLNQPPAIVRHRFAFLILLFGCSFPSKNEKKAATQTSVLSPAFVTHLAIYLLENESITDATLSDQARQSLKSFPMTAAPSADSLSILKDGFYLTRIQKGDEGFMKPDIESWPSSFFQLTEKELQAFSLSDRNLDLVFFGTSNDVVEKQKQIADFIYALTKEKKVVIADLVSIEFYSPTTWKTRRVDAFQDQTIDITGHVTIHIYREGEFCRAVTLGMSNFCLPEISIRNFPCSDQISYGNLINAVTQTLVENPFINADSTLHVELKKIKNKKMRDLLLSDIKTDAQLATSVKLKWASPEEGDNPFVQLLIAFENPKYSSPQEEAHQLVADLFGMQESYTVAQHDDELLAASENAKKRLPELRALFNKGLDPGYSIMVKAPFETPDGGHEWMWVEVTRWKGEQMEGVLQNDPYEIPDLKVGAIVIFSELEVFDYMLNKPDGTSEGNETGKILEGRE